jgi:predicted SprT family Zn-dependent metalloprotease
VSAKAQKRNQKENAMFHGRSALAGGRMHLIIATSLNRKIFIEVVKQANIGEVPI